MSIQQEHGKHRRRFAQIAQQLQQFDSLPTHHEIPLPPSQTHSPMPIEVGIQNSEELFRAYVETANDMVYTVDLAGNLTYINDYGQRILKCDCQQWQGRPYLDFIAPSYRQETAQAFANLLGTGELKDFEFVLQPLEGQPIHMEVNGRLLFRNGKLIGGIGIARDITERKRFEQQLQMFVRAVESAYDSAAIVDLEGNIIYANSATERMFGYDVGSLVGKNAAIFYPEDSPVPIQWLIQQAILPHRDRSDLFNLGGWSGEVTCLRRTQERFSALVSVSPILNENGRPTAVSMTCRDITGQKAIQAELAAKNLELERASQLKSRFLANMSHELRTPLTSILGFSSLLEQQIFGELNPKQLQYIQRIHHSGEHLLNLIKDVLDLSKVEAGKVKLDIEPISIPQVCEATLSLVGEQARNRGREIVVSIQPDLPLLMADELRVRQMLLNLLSNAIKFSLEGGKIGLEAKTQAGYLHLVVWDEGIGIPEDKQALLFQPFEQLDSNGRQHEGTGLGLALTRQLAELHGGTVECESKQGKGSRFTISLPLNLHQNPATELSESSLKKNSRNGRGKSSSSSLLLVEDHQYNAMLLRDVLQYWGYEVHHVGDGREALDWLHQNHPDLILMDIQLPGLDGLELTRKIKANPDWQSIPVVATTALAMLGDRERCLEAGAQDYLTKPVNCDRLAAVLKKYLKSNSSGPSGL
ncbi:MAG: PAS domain S-box protein [Cyanobacteriota bacterium]|nr:PAS domain S-box protein [Cyanobacteriota bacterium]